MAKDMKFAWALFLAVATAHLLYSQEPTPPQPVTDAPAMQSQKSDTEAKTEVSVQDTGNTFKLRVNLVQVPVVVRNNTGEPVEGLRKEDFQLFDNGKPQPISTFAVESAQSRKQRGEAEEKTQESEGENGAGGSVALPERFVALTFDDVHLKMEDAGPLRVAAGKFVDAMMPADRVGIFSTSGQFTLDFTNEKEALKQKLLGLVPRGRISNSTGACPNISFYMADRLEREGWPVDPDQSGPPDFEVFVQETLRCMSGINVKTARTLVINAARSALDTGEAENRETYRQLGSVLRTLSSKPGTRILLFASPGFPLAMLTKEASGVVDLANRASIVINTIDARGLYALAPGGDISEAFSDAPSTAGLKTSFRVTEQSEQQFVLMDFAYGTGGTFFHSNDFEAALNQAGSAPEVSYVLGFSPQNQKMDGRYHALKVTLSGPNEYAIQARRGYFAPKKLDDPREAAKQEIQDAVFSQNEIVDLPLTLQIQYFKLDDTATRLSVVSHLDVQRMQFHKADGRNFDDLTVATVIFDDNGKFVMGGEKFVKMRFLDSSIARYGHTGFVVKSTFDLKPGKYTVRQVARDSEGAQMAARNAIVVIPN